MRCYWSRGCKWIGAEHPQSFTGPSVMSDPVPAPLSDLGRGWHLVSRITDVRRSRMPGDRRCQPRPRSERGAGTGLDLTLGPGSDCGCSAPIHLHLREHRNHARTGIMFRRRARRRPACPSTQAPRQHRCGSLACRRHRYPHSHPTQTWRRSSRRRPPCVRGRMPQCKINVLHVNVCMPECPCCATTRGGTCHGY